MNAPKLSSWSAVVVALCAALALLASAVPAFELAIEAVIGAGDTQRGFVYERELTPLAEMWPEALLIAAPALLLLALSLAALRWGSTAWLVLPACAVALVGLRVVLDVETRLDWGDGIGVIGYEQEHGGVLLQPALDDLKRSARDSREARNPDWSLVGGEHGYRARGLHGWWLLERVSILAALLTSYRCFRLWLAPRQALVLTGIATLAIAVWLFLQALSGLS